MKPDTQKTVKEVITLVLQTFRETSKQLKPLESAIFRGTSRETDDNSRDNSSNADPVIATPMVNKENNVVRNRNS